VRSRDRRGQPHVARPDAWSPGRAPSENTSRARHTNVHEELCAPTYVGFGVLTWRAEAPRTSVHECFAVKTSLNQSRRDTFVVVG
jgi:hypothetical protein